LQLPYVDSETCNAAAGADCDHAQQAQSLFMLLLYIFADSLQCQDVPGDASCDGWGHIMLKVKEGDSQSSLFATF